MKNNKYEYAKVIQQNYGYGYGYEDVSEYACNSLGVAFDRPLLKHDLKEYRLTGYATRVIFRKTIKK